MGDTFSWPRHRRPAARRRRGRRAGRADQLRLAVRPAPGARLPGLRVRAGRHGDAGRGARRSGGHRDRRPDVGVPAGPDGPRGGAVRPRASPWSSSPSGRRSAAWAGCCSSTPTSSTASSASSPSSSGWASSAGCPCCSAPSGSPPAPPPGWPGRRCSASCSAWAGRPASARPSRRSTRWPSPRPRPPAARCSGVAYCVGLGVPFVLVALGARWAMGATSFLRRHARTVTRVGGAVLVRRRPAAAHRRLDRDHAAGCARGWPPPASGRRAL